MSRPSKPSTKARVLDGKLGPKKAYIVAGICLTAVLIAGVGYTIWSSGPIIDKTLTEGASFPVYVPAKTPGGYEVDEQKTKLSNDMLTYTFTPKTVEDKDIVVTVQPLPKDFNMNRLIGSGTVTSTSTDSGMLYDLSTSQKTQYLLNTGDALVFFTSIGSIDAATINSLVSDLDRQS